jgi:hypothetical protein
VESCCEFGIEPSGSMKCWGNYYVQVSVQAKRCLYTPTRPEPSGNVPPYVECRRTEMTSQLEVRMTLTLPLSLCISICCENCMQNRLISLYILQISLYLQSQPCVLFLKYFSLTFSHDMFRPPGPSSSESQTFCSYTK